MRHSNTHARVVPKFSAIDCTFHCVCERENTRTSKKFENLIGPICRTYIRDESFITSWGGGRYIQGGRIFFGVVLGGG